MTDQEVSEFRYSVSNRKPKRNYKADIRKPSSLDQCGTPAYALDLLLPYIPRDWGIWEPAAGAGRMVRTLENKGYSVLGSTIENGENFFDLECEAADCIITNPPYGIKFQWIERCYELGKPFALLLPVETIGAQRAQRSMKKYGVELLLLNRRVDFFMPKKGFEGSAQFPVCWFCWQLLPEQICYGDLIKSKQDDETVDVISEEVEA